MGLYLIDEADRCLQCKKPMCQQGCPVHTPIPQAIAAFKAHDVLGAGQMLFENNPLSLACSVVCNHEQQCAGHCVLGRKGAPVHFFDIEKYISDAYLDRMTVSVPERKPQNVAVIGAGPAGMTVAFILAQNGYGVTIFEWKDKIGGVMQYGIPEFRLPKTVLERYKARLLELGVKIRPNTTIGAVLKVEDLLRDGYAAVFVGTGVWKPRNLGIPGECLGNVHFGLDYLVDPDAYELGKRVAVLGMQNIEETHPLGRLFDIDVLDSEGHKLSRPQYRPCLICGNQAQLCARTRRHTVAEMQAKIEEMLSTWKNSNV